jgi:hypothetical protein
MNMNGSVIVTHQCGGQVEIDYLIIRSSDPEENDQLEIIRSANVDCVHYDGMDMVDLMDLLLDYFQAENENKSEYD